jgi:hypothetical protein
VPAFKIVPSGLINNVQTWSTGIWIVPVPTVGTFIQSNLDSCVAAFNGFFATWWTAVKPFASVNTDWRRTTLYYYSAGSTTATGVSVSTASGTVVGTGAAFNPVQTSIVHSLRSAVPNRSGRGRMYVPGTGAGLVTPHQWSLAQTLTQANATKALITSLNAFTSVPGNVTAATVQVISFTHGQNALVTSLVVDSDPDIQRRRSDKILPSSSTSLLIP